MLHVTHTSIQSKQGSIMKRAYCHQVRRLCITMTVKETLKRKLSHEQTLCHKTTLRCLFEMKMKTFVLHQQCIVSNINPRWLAEFSNNLASNGWTRFIEYFYLYYKVELTLMAHSKWRFTNILIKYVIMYYISRRYVIHYYIH